MKIPRDVSGDVFIRALQGLGYNVMRQKGSHVRLRHPGPPAHLISVPRHSSLKVGTLQALLNEVSFMRSRTIESILSLL